MESTYDKKGENFQDLAKKLRMQRFDADEIQYYKQTAIYGEKVRNRRKRSAIVIQKQFRGFIVRKLIGAKLEEINNQAVITYLQEKRKSRIAKKSKAFLSHFINDYVKRQREMKRVILFDYFNYCSSQISSTLKGFMYRKTFKPYYLHYRESANTVINICLFYKVREILKCSKIQTILSEITKLKFVVNLIEKQDLTQEKVILFGSEEISDLEVEFFNSKCAKLKQDLLKKLRNANKTLYDTFYNLYLNGNWVNFRSKKSDYQWNSCMKDEVDREEFIKMYNNLEYKMLKKDDKNDNSKNEPKESSSNLEVVNNNEEQPNQMDEELVNNEEKTPLNPDDRVIKPSSFGYNLDNLDSEMQGSPTNTKTPVKNIEHIKRKKPKYDARKAIEDAKNNEKKPKESSIKKDRDNFRAFIKSVKNENPEAKEKTRDSPDKNAKSQKSKLTPDQELEKELREKLKQIDSGKEETNKVKDSTNRQARKKEQTKESEKRKRLHELEKSPKKVITNKVKSKIDCWGNENTLPTYSQKRKAHEVKKPNFNPQILSKIEVEFNNIATKLNLSSFNQLKQEKFKNSQIAYITENSFYVKHYSPEIYDQLLIHLNKHYEELKN